MKLFNDIFNVRSLVAVIFLLFLGVISYVIANQQQRIVLLEQDSQNLKQQLSSQKNKMQQVETAGKDVGAKVETLSQEMKEWLKQYVAVLAKIEQRTAASETKIQDLQEKVDSQNIPGINEKIQSLQATVDGLVHPPSVPQPGQVQPDKPQPQTPN
jgi:peptidoglycan hydrolase CwlO-like protein